MTFVNPSDKFEVSKQSLIGDVDQEILFDFYTPIIGSKAVLLWNLLLRCDKEEPSLFRDFLVGNQFSQSDFAGCLPPLEAIGLLKTFTKKEKGFDSYIFLLFAPKTPSEFFSNELLSALLTRFLDESKIAALKAKYLSETPSLDGYKDITTDFSSFFQFDDTFAPLEKEGANVLGKRSGSVNLAFDRNLFFAALSEASPDFPPEAISKEELVRIARIATLHCFDEYAMASLALRSYEPRLQRGKRIDFKKLRELANSADSFSFAKKAPIESTSSDVHGSTAYAKTIRLMEKMSPTEWLSRLQKGNKPAKTDLRLLDTLVNDIGLPESVTNALIFFVLSTNDNVLNSNYVEKVGASLVRAGISNALDAMNYLGERTNKDAGYGLAPKAAKKNALPFSSDLISPKANKEKQEEGDEDPLDILASL